MLRTLAGLAALNVWIFVKPAISQINNTVGVEAGVEWLLGSSMFCSTSITLIAHYPLVRNTEYFKKASRWRQFQLFHV